MASTLMAHSPKFKSKLVSVDQLRALPEPQALGIRHKPIPHAVLIDQIKEEMQRRDLVPVREQYALSAKGQALFGVIDLEGESILGRTPGERGMSVGLRSSTDSSLSIQLVAGSRVFVCDNLSMSGDMIAVHRKSTTRLDLGSALVEGFAKFLEHEYTLDLRIAELSAYQLEDGEAKQRIFDVFNAKVLPVRLFDDVARAYFQASDQTPDTQPRSLWGLQNAFTRAMRDMTPVSQFQATVRLGKAFAMTTREAQEEGIEISEVSDGD